jgi:hypothetical protein
MVVHLINKYIYYNMIDNVNLLILLLFIFRFVFVLVLIFHISFIHPSQINIPVDVIFISFS